MGEVHLVGTGARTPLGLSAPSSAAAVRAGISGLGTHPFMVDRNGERMPGAIDVELDTGTPVPQRMIAMAETALREACRSLAEVDTRQHVSMPIFVGLPEMRPGFSERDVNTVRAGIGALADLPVGISEVAVMPQGHASGLAAFAAAVQRIRAGALNACIVGGVDSYFDADTMDWLDDNRQLTGATSRSSFVPGEGAGFCVLMSDVAAEAIGVEPAAVVLSAAVGQEQRRIKTSELCLGVGLTDVVERAVSESLPSRPMINAIVCDMNGERYRAEEWGFVCLRLPEYFEDPTSYSSPADCWGDVGAASGPLFATLVCEAAARGYARGPISLLWTSSENGLRAATLVMARSQR